MLIDELKKELKTVEKVPHAAVDPVIDLINWSLKLRYAGLIQVIREYANTTGLEPYLVKVMKGKKDSRYKIAFATIKSELAMSGQEELDTTTGGD